MPDRKYVLTKVASGDYLLPSNDGTRMWRIVRYTDMVASGNGKRPTPRDFWAAWRWRKHVHPTAEFPDLEDWSEWEEMDSLLATRKEAIDAALRITKEP